MELIAIILSSVLSTFSNGGWIIDAIAQKQLNSYVESAEKLAIRVDNTPNYQIAQGKIDRLRVAGRGLYLEPDLRIASLELETDEISVNLADLSTKSLDELRESLKKPLQGAVSLIVTERDLVDALASEAVIAKLQSALNDIVTNGSGSTAIAYQVIAPHIELVGDDSISFTVTLRRQRTTATTNRVQELAIALDIGFELIQGKKINISKLEGTVNNQPMSQRLLKGFAEGISDRLDLTTIEKQGIFARLLQLEVTEDQIEIVGFARMETKSVSIDSSNN